MGGAASVVSPAIEKLNDFVLSEKYKQFVDTNTCQWIAVANTIGTHDPGRTDDKPVHVFPKKNPNRETVDLLGLVRFFVHGEKPTNKIVEFFQDGLIEHLNGLDHKEMVHHFDNEKDSQEAREAIFADCLPPVYVDWDHWDDVRVHSQVAFEGLGQYYLAAAKKDRADVTVPENAVYEIDLSEWAKYEVREGIEPYGTISYFGEDRMPVGVWWCSKNKLVLPADEDYQHVAMLSRVTLKTRVTLREHLSEVHWTVSNGLLLASERHLDSEHPIRRLTKPHTYGGAEVNTASLTGLAPYKSLAWRNFGFTKDSWPEMIKDQINAYRYHNLEEHFVQSGLPNELRTSMPLYRDGLELYQIFERYVRRYVDIFYADDAAVLSDGELNDYWGDFATQIPNGVYSLPALSKESLIAQLTYSFFHVTAFHQYVGASMEYLLSPYGMCGSITTNSNAATIQSFLNILVLMIMTHSKQPALINNWTHLHAYLEERNKTQHEQVLAAIQDWQAELVAQSEALEQRNKDRKLQGNKNFVAMDPKIMDCSVSV